jgi:TonB family protein
MKTPILFVAAAAAFLPVHAHAARVPEAQQVMGLDLSACPRPTYPAAALAERAGGKTTVEVQIGEAGLVTDARVLASSGRTDLDEAALAGIRRCMFHAVLATGQAPTGWLKTQYVWIPGEAKNAEAQDQALFASTKTLAAAGDAAAQNNLGVLYSRGAGVPLDKKQAVYWYTKAAEQGHGWAQSNLAHAYQYGTAGEVDIDKALYWLTKPAAGGLPVAQVALGLLTMQRAASDAERSTAASWLARASARNEPAGHYFLGRTFELGLGNVQDQAQAAALYRKALDRSGGRAEIALGMLIEAGRAGAGDPAEAAKLYQKAMQWRYPPAYYHYGLVLEQRGDTDLAAAVFRQGAELGDCDAVVKYVQVRQVAGTTPVAGSPEAHWEQRAQWCKTRPALPERL